MYPNSNEETNKAGNRLRPTFTDKQKYDFLKMPYACKVCDVAPDEDTAVVLEAFFNLPKYKLVVIAEWKGTETATALYKKYAGAANIILLNKPCILQDIKLITQNCFVYIQGASVNNIAFLSRAMLAGLPVIACSDAENIYITNNKAFYFDNSNELKKIITEKTIAEFKEVGKQMHMTAEIILEGQV